ncbi:MAG: hypothetical protein D4R43_01960 [Sphingobacteriales bacterium]|nr:MAG: hypothetical protein D4R43_01960 [Sphingobacteriales bacterium]
MKKITAIISIVLMSFSAFAQKPVKGDMGFTMGFNGLSVLGVTPTAATGTLLFRYYITDNLAGRAALNFSNSNFSTSLTDTGGAIITTSTKSSSWAVSLGIQKSCGTIKNIEPFCGADIYVGGGMSNKTDNKTLLKSGDFFEEVTTPGSTFSFGVTPFVGFNWFFTDHFSLGAEFGWGVGMSNTKAGSTVSTTHFGSTDTVITTPSASAKGMSIGTNSSGLITFSVFFD